VRRVIDLPLVRGICLGLVWCLGSGGLIAQTTSEGKKHHKKKPAVSEEASPTPQVEETSSPQEESSSASPSSSKSRAAPDATISADQLVEYSTELPRVRKLIDTALALTTEGLTYTYGSNDPARGGMDCSGFTSYILQSNGFNDVPRDASEQYIWLRKAGTFRVVLSNTPDTFELDDLRPGDLLFWMGTTSTNHDPAITHTMIYLGTEKGTKHRIMVGSSDGRSYQGQSRWGVSVFDFQLEAPHTSESNTLHPHFIGYGRPPGLRD
jgi:cell wall-associated NlpC family hydrolase